MKDKKSFEVKLERLKEIVTALEKGDLALEDGVALFKEGQKLAKSCSVQLEEAKNEVKIVEEESLKDFDYDDQNEE